MSDPEVPQPEQPSDVNDVVDSAKAGLAEAEAARGDASAAPEPTAAETVDPDLAAFEEMERAHPGTFAATSSADATASADRPSDAQTDAALPAAAQDDAPTTSIADTAYLPSAADDAETKVVPSEPVADTVIAPASTIVSDPVTHQPIFVQAPEPPRDRGNRGTAGAIGLLAAIVFAILFLGVLLAAGAIAGDVALEHIGEAALEPLTTFGFWTPVVVFFLAFWLLGVFVNRSRWGLWVILGLLVGVASYFGFILGQLIEARFWLITPATASELVDAQAFTVPALAAFVIGRELTIWFGAWVARSGARKTELNAEAQREYERTIEAGPQLPR